MRHIQASEVALTREELEFLIELLNKTPTEIPTAVLIGELEYTLETLNQMDSRKHVIEKAKQMVPLKSFIHFAAKDPPRALAGG